MLVLLLRTFPTIFILFTVTNDLVYGNPVSSQNENGELTFQIVHTNDMHARFEETSKMSVPICPKQDVKAGNCYGGFARIATLVRQARNSSIPTLFLNAGDTYQGSVWYNIYKWKIVVQFLNILAPDAISLGNHEFDDGVNGLIPFIENAKFPVLATNLDLSKEPNLKATKLANSTVLLINGTKIGVIGYLTPDTTILSSTENVIINDEVPAIREEAKKLKKEGVNILIALGHSGFNVDKKIAKEVEDIDLVIGGHTNTFLYRGKQPDIEHPEGFYPTEIIQDNGRRVYVVQAYAYTKYLGNFSVTFDSNGEITHIEGNPILVDHNIDQAPDIIEELDLLRPAIDNITSLEIGRTRVLLNGDSKICRKKECNLGNLITDAIVDYNAQQYFVKGKWTDAAIAVQNSGNIRASITRDLDDKITMGDILGVLPFGNTIFKVSMTGEQVLSMLEWSVYNLHQNSSDNLFGAFLQFSGLQVLYDISRPVNSKVVSVKVRCAACNIPSYSDLNKTATYNVLMSDFMRNGGDGYKMLKDLQFTTIGVTIADIVSQYLKKYSPVYTGVDWRINYIHELYSDKIQDTEYVNKIKNKDTSSAPVKEHSIGLIILLMMSIGLLT
ncbi:PREDICTED: protein 5NUC-like [Polistes dominula]|uniref:5'-nucleotidase n=1 Tax=Polistes dominula TaxID=743375 RepID=A0ABM1JGZ3_POLDO|nr:PREDICTED: protein 5NUC-like [Polistes dominula]XP_015191731.1 PREDICTED: protein 5NUC-like [Polistes dominula]XP_015191732.1 PREDICTED: protein 5NUC-like [Polistes dominula]